MDKTMILWTKLWYYGKKNYGTLLRTMELLFTKDKKQGRLQKLRNLNLQW